MGRPGVFLKPTVVAEPLVNRWYAWPYLIAPAPAAMYTANSHVKVMSSFVATPQIHVAALRNPAMIGGPFINYDETRVDEIRALLDHTRKVQAPLLALADAIKALDELLAREATGFSLAELYPRIPEALRGYVELVYDLANHPSARFIEGLLYESPYYDPSCQGLDLFLGESDDRSFAFSTPRLPEPGRLSLAVPFASPAVDALFAMRQTPAPFADIKDALGVDARDEALLATCFTETPPAPPARFEGDGVRVRYFGHACVLIEARGVSILVDPVLAYPGESPVPRYSFGELPPTIDYVLITHNHQDHCMFETLLPLRHRIRNLVVPRSGGGSLVDPSLRLVLERVGFRRVREIDEMESLAVEGGSIRALPFMGEHGDLNIRTKAAYLVTLAGRSLLMVADSNNIEPRLYERAHALTGDVDALFVGMECDGGPLSWLYGPLLTRPLSRKMDQSRRFDGSDCDKALALVDALGVSQVYVYAMGQEPWLKYLTSIVYTEASRPIVESDKLIATCRARGLTAERLYGCRELPL
jgi:L-ascorbate metabolism protein UlaG (beta-lactamase superfamily)